MTSEEIKKAMKEFLPVVYNGNEYERINAYTYRIYKNQHTGRYREAFQVELQSIGANSVTIAEADKVKLKG